MRQRSHPDELPEQPAEEAARPANLADVTDEELAAADAALPDIVDEEDVDDGPTWEAVEGLSWSDIEHLPPEASP